MVIPPFNVTGSLHSGHL
nr:valyl-tRNA synthetase, VRS {internal fragment, peptide 1} [Artemia=brine shrimps, nauplii, Peptide Partial, 17 aa] [Artemia]